VKIGDLVKYMHETIPRRKNSDCGIWEWRRGLIIDFPSKDKVSILYKGKIVIVHIDKIQEIIS
tara:strand:- start:495 stop:683 length:189 start_codon:yes stop_codon:yes gene_type:complete